jgi:predicted hydrocarbon binding protein
LSIQEFYEFQTGAIKRRVSNARVFLVSARSWSIIQQNMFLTFSSGAAVVLQEMGRAYGADMAKEGKRWSPHPPDALRALQSLAGVSGWGTVTLRGDPIYESGLTIAVDGCVFCSELPLAKTGDGACHFLRGIIKGLTDGLYEGSHDVKETTCMARGDGRCTFRVTRSA